jgi:hypothetical protein
MSYIFLLTCHEAESEDKVAQVEALSLESLQEQLHKIESAIKEYEADQEVKAQAEYDRQREDGEI